MDERSAHFFASVARICGEARLASLRVEVRLVSGREVAGVPRPVRETEGAGEVDDTGYADEIGLENHEPFALSDVLQIVLNHPKP